MLSSSPTSASISPILRTIVPNIGDDFINSEDDVPNIEDNVPNVEDIFTNIGNFRGYTHPRSRAASTIASGIVYSSSGPSSSSHCRSQAAVSFSSCPASVKFSSQMSPM